MTLNEYQTEAGKTAIYPMDARYYYAALGLTGEAGEVAEKVKKMIRDDGGIMTTERRALLKKELGDVMWYVATLASDLELTLEEIAQHNVEKLKVRIAQNMIVGDGDRREELAPPITN